MEEAIHTVLLRHSTAYRAVEPDVLQELAVIAGKHGVNPGDLAAAFDRFMTINRFGAARVTMDDVQAFSSSDSIKSSRCLADATNTPGQNRPHGKGVAQPSQRISPYMQAKTVGSGVRSVLATVTGPGSAPTRSQEPPTPPARTATAPAEGGPLAAVCSFNPDLPSCTAQPGAPRPEVLLLGRVPPAGFRFGGDRLETRAGYLESRITAWESALAEAGDETVRPHPVGAVSQTPTTFVGRICCESGTEHGRLNPQSVLLEGSDRVSAGARVKLDLSRVPSYRLFPGQVVAVRGTNPSGHCIVAAEVRTCRPSIDSTDTHMSPGNAGTAQPLTAGTPPTAIVAAAGPFTAPTDLEYAPLHALLRRCRELRPEVLLLLGPFVDEAHPLLGAGLVDETFQSVFDNRVLTPLRNFAESQSSTRVLLVPSVQDLHQPPVLPSPAPALPAWATNAGITALPNPSTVDVTGRGLTLGACSVDWLLASGREELVRRDPELGPPPPGERTAALAAGVIDQGSYFPLFPPPPGLPLDCGAAVTGLALPQDTADPAVLLTPSDLAPFARIMPGGRTSVAINPGRASRGSFARICSAPAVNRQAAACDAIRVDIYRL